LRGPSRDGNFGYNPYYIRNIEKGKREKKSWYQYVFLGLAWENEATAEVRRIGVPSPIPSDQST
jgi:hypothetical protein